MQLRRIGIAVAAAAMALTMTGCHKKTAAEIAQEKKAAEVAKRKAAEAEKRKYMRTESADYVTDLFNANGGGLPKSWNTTMTLYGKISDIGSDGKSITIVASDDDYAMTTIATTVSDEKLEKKVKALDKGSLVRMKGRLAVSSGLSFTPVSIEKADAMCDYFGENAPKDKTYRKGMAVRYEDLAYDIEKNPYRASKKYDGKVITLTGTITRDEGSTNSFGTEMAQEDSTGMQKNAVTISVINSRAVQRQLHDAKNGQEMTFTGKFSAGSSTLTI